MPALLSRALSASSYASSLVRLEPCFFPCEAGAGFSPRPLPAHMSLCVKQNKAEYGEFPGGPVVKNLATNAGDTGLILGPGRVHVL